MTPIAVTPDTVCAAAIQATVAAARPRGLTPLAPVPPGRVCHIGATKNVNMAIRAVVAAAIAVIEARPADRAQ
jgi:hypothetical protein